MWARLRHRVRKCILLNRQERLDEDSKASRQLSRAAAGHPIWKLHRKSSWSGAYIRDKSPCANQNGKRLPVPEQSLEYPGAAYRTALLRSQSPGWPTDMRAVALDNHMLSKIRFCLYCTVKKARNDASWKLMQTGEDLDSGGMKSTADCFLFKQLHIRQKCQGQHKRIFTKCSWSESTPTLKEKHKRQIRSWSQKSIHIFM